MNRLRYLLHILAVAIVTAIAVSACGGSADADTNDSESLPDSSDIHRFPDTLRVGTLYSPTSYFIYRETEMGYDYDLVNRLAADKGIAVRFIIANNLTQAVEMLDSGKIDLLAYEVPVTAEYRDHVTPCGVENITHQVLVQPRSDTYITDVTQLVGKEVYVENNSKYFARMQNLNNELGGGIIIKPVERDTMITEDLIAMVSDGEIPLTVVDSDIASVNKTYFRDLDITLEVSFPQRSAWGVAPGNQWLADSINAWASGESPRRQRAALLKRYYELSKQQGGGAEIYNLDFSKGRMSPFDHLFRRYAPKIGWDWRLLAAVGYAESRYDSAQVSWAGARGIMQLMPATAKAFGLGPDRITENEPNISASVEVFRSLDRSLSNAVKDPQERIKFILAAYNSGLAHILDAIVIAKKTGRKADIWDGNVAEALLLKSNPEYYNDPDCRYGYFRGRQTYEYVKTVMACYDKAKKQIR